MPTRIVRGFPFKSAQGILNELTSTLLLVIWEANVAPKWSSPEVLNKDDARLENRSLFDGGGGELVRS